ncbi:MAG: hypothetical protein AB1750_16880 [Chloroflexota bacterium]
MKKLIALAALAAFALACGLAGNVQPQAEPTATAAKPTATQPAKPLPGATYSGPIQIKGEYATSGTITFVISADGASIVKVGVGFTDLKCPGVTIGKADMSVTVNEPISDTLDFSADGIGDIQGKFDSPTSASGTIRLKVVVGMGITCDMGEWDWSATAQ